MFTLKAKIFISAIVVLTLTGLGVTTIIIGAQNTATQKDSMKQSTNSIISKSIDLVAEQNSQILDLNVTTNQLDLSLVSSSNSSVENISQIYLKGVLNNMEIAHKDKKFTLSTKEKSLIELQFSSTSALDLAKKLDKSFVIATGVFKDTIFVVNNLTVSKFDGPNNNIQTQSFTGQNKFATILCKFSDIATEGQSPSWFQNRMEGSGLDSTKTYWSEISDNTVNVSGGQVFGWYTLPHPRSYYVNATNSGDIYRMFNDCTGVAESSVYFPNFNGINLFFNSTIDGFAAGIGTLGRWSVYLDSSIINIGVTWLGSNGWINSSILQHELGHTAALQHSSTEQDEYGSRWDVMSYGFGFESGITGALPSGLIAYSRWLSGLIPQDQVQTINISDNATYKLGQVNQYIPATDTKRMLIIPISNTKFYTIEARKKVGFDKYIPQAGVLIHNIDLTRDNPAFVEDIQNDGDVNNSGSVLTLNQQYSKNIDNFTIKVVADYTTGYEVQVLDNRPVVNITSPASRLLTGANYSLTANAVDSNGTISKVEFYKSGQLIATDTTSPYQNDLTNLTNGDYSFSAKAYDNDGNVSVSNTTIVTVASTNNYTSIINGINIEFTHTTGQFRFYGSFSDLTSCGKALDINHTTDGLQEVLVLQRQPTDKSKQCKQGIYKYDFDKTIGLPFLNYSQLQNFTTTTFKFKESYSG